MATEIFLSGNEETLKPIITLLAGLHQMLDNKDIGQFLGTNVEEFVRANPHTIRMKIIYYSKKEPPYKLTSAEYQEGKKITRAIYNIPDLNKKECTWNNIKKLAGGSDGYMWGRFRATANLDNGRQMQVYGATEKEAEDRLKDLLKLSKAKLTTLSVAEEKNEGRRATDKWMFKESVRMYPASFSIINSQKIINQSNKQIKKLTSGKKRSNLSGDYVEYGTIRIALWNDKAPKNINKIIDEAFRIPLVDDD